MNKILESTDELINKFNNSNIVDAIKNNDIDSKAYKENIDMLNYHIYYLNKEINKLINNKICRGNNESN